MVEVLCYPDPVVFTPKEFMLPFLQYVRVSSDTPPRVIYHLMTQHWGLDAPNLLISVTGGAKNFIMKPRLKNIFRQGLVKVAQTTGKKCRDFPCSCSERGACHLAIPGSVSWAAEERLRWPRRPVGLCLDYHHQFLLSHCKQAPGSWTERCNTECDSCAARA